MLRPQTSNAKLPTSRLAFRAGVLLSTSPPGTRDFGHCPPKRFEHRFEGEMFGRGKMALSVFGNSDGTSLQVSGCLAWAYLATRVTQPLNERIKPLHE